MSKKNDKRRYILEIPAPEESVQEMTVQVKSGNPYRDGSGRFGSGGGASEEFYHGTSDTAAKEIAKHGFSLGNVGENSGSDGFFGRGIYLTTKKSAAKQYGNKLLSVHLRPKLKIITYDDPATYFKIADGKSPKQLTDYFKSKGYEGLRLTDSKAGDELVIFNPKDIVFIKENK